MKKLFISAFMSFAIFAMVSCSSNPAIKAAEDFIDNPTLANSLKVEKAMEDLSEEEKEEFNKWELDHTVELSTAMIRAMKEMTDEFEDLEDELEDEE